MTINPVDRSESKIDGKYDCLQETNKRLCIHIATKDKKSRVGGPMRYLIINAPITFSKHKDKNGQGQIPNYPA